ncbi:N-acetyltransferase [Nocardioides sp. JQ2195]|uniref:GNAT family N-acetyltransferase n=1 Tax=Nocardioides sp. JQ2195 TaxID=2592334 RepID=UPI00143E342E|nr:N-acetyltransferase [Nocardioides sp. JQ2195]QIX25192.1 N-acetyltransferase [Nocardioides sp. JQ2195]
MTTIRPAVPTDHDAVRRVVDAAFEDTAVSTMVRGIRTSEFFRPDLDLVAVADGEVVGHVMVSGTTLRGEAGERTIAMLTPLAVRPDTQRQGIGTLLIAAALGAADDRGEPLVVLEGSPAYYGARGFTSSVAHGIHITLPGWAPPEAAQVALLSAYDPEDPSLRGDVVYPPAVAAVAD